MLRVPAKRFRHALTTSGKTLEYKDTEQLWQQSIEL